MKPIKRMLSSVAYKLANMGKMTFPRAASWFFSWADAGMSDYQREVADGYDNNAIMAPILWISRAFQEAPLVVETEQEKEDAIIDRRHAMVKLIKRPNVAYTGIMLWFATLLSFLLDGNAYWYKVRGSNGKILELWYLPHWMVTPVGDEKTFITHYAYAPGGTTLKLDPKDLVHFRYGINPHDMRKGMGLLNMVLAEVYADNEAAKLVAALLKNKGMPGLLISPDKDVTFRPEDEDALKDYVKQKFTGSRRGEPMVLGAATKVQQFGFNPHELDLSALRGVSEERVCAILGLPAVVVGFGSGVKGTKVGATMREFVKLAWSGCINPLQRMLAEELNAQLLPEFETNEMIQVKFDNSEVEALQADAVTSAQALDTAVKAGLMTRAEGRRKLDLETQPSDDVFLVPINLQEVPRGGEAAMPDPAPIAAPAAGLLPQAGGKPPKVPALPAPLPKNFKRLSRAQSGILQANDRLKKKHREKLFNNMKEYFRRFGNAIAYAYDHTGKAAADDEIRVEAMFDNMGMRHWESELRAVMGAHYVSVYNEQAALIASMDLTVNLPDSVQVDILRMGGKRAELVDMTESTKKRAMEVLADAREQGLGVDEVAKRLREEVPGGPWQDAEYRADLIARTETQYAQTRSALLAYRSIEGMSQVVMIDARLGPTDVECEELNGTVANFDEAEKLLDDEHPNGTRDIVPILEEVA